MTKKHDEDKIDGLKTDVQTLTTDVRHMSVLLEQTMAQNQLILEAVGDMQEKVSTIPAIQEDIATLKTDMKIVKAAVTDTNKELHALERRVTRLEAAA
jgi:polyhydroxyalkanoate synthesis regulator phasin